MNIFFTMTHSRCALSNLYVQYTAIHNFNPLNAKLNPICHLLALLGAHHILHVSRIKVKIKLGKKIRLIFYAIIRP